MISVFNLEQKLINDGTIINDKLEFCRLLQALKFSSKYGMRDRMVYLLSVATGLDIDTILNLKVLDVFTQEGAVKKNIKIKDKNNIIRICPTLWIQSDLVSYKVWLDNLKMNQDCIIYQKLRSPSHKLCNGRIINKYDIWMFPDSNFVESLRYSTYQDIIDKAFKIAQIDKDIDLEDIIYTGAFILFAGDFDSEIKISGGQLKYNCRTDMSMHFLGIDQKNGIYIDSNSYMKYIRSITAFNI